MNTEYEVRVLEINHDEMVKKLENLGAEFKFFALQQRYVYDVKPKQENKWIRLRTDGKKTTLTIKDLQTKTIDGTKELEIVVVVPVAVKLIQGSIPEYYFGSLYQEKNS